MQNKIRCCNSGMTASRYGADGRYRSRTRTVGQVSNPTKVYHTITHKNRKEVASRSINIVSTRLRTGAFVVAQEVVQSKEKRLLIALRTTSHPVPLHHKLDRFLGSRRSSVFGFFFHFNDLFATILGEKDACSALATRSQSRVHTCLRMGQPPLYFAFPHNRNHSQCNRLRGG